MFSKDINSTSKLIEELVMDKSHPCFLALVLFVLLLTVGCVKPRAYIGVELDEFNLVKNVVPDNPAQQAGIKLGDIILGIKIDNVEDTSSGDRKNSSSAGRVIEQIKILPIGKPASIIILRNGQELTLTITASHPPPPVAEFDGIWIPNKIVYYPRKKFPLLSHRN